MQVPSVFRELPVAAEPRDRAAAAPAEGRRSTPRRSGCSTFLELRTQAAQPAGKLSHGQQQWLEIGMALALKPRLLLLDEPTAGMSPEETFRTGELIQRLNAEGMTVLVVEHDMTFVRQIAQRVTVLHFGQVFAQGTIEAIVADPRVAEIYLGKTPCRLNPSSTVAGLRPATAGRRSCRASTSTIRRGEIVSLIGRNGVGKTTILRCLIGLLPRDARARSTSRAATSRACRPMRARGSASATFPRAARCSRA